MLSVARRTGVVLALIIVLTTLLVPVAAAAPAAAAPAAAQMSYVVRPGDTLYKIAARFGVSASSIAYANNIRNWNRIYVGQVLIIPGAYVPPPAPPPCTTCGTTGAVYYTVRPGDTLGTIAARYGTTYTYLAQLNNLPNVNCIYVGQVLLISPGGTSGCTYGCPPPPPPPPPTCPPNCGTSGLIGPWTGDYFATPDLSGSITVKRLDTAVDFNWGWNPPAAGMPNFNWTSRWTTLQNLAGGTYRAWISVDDGARVYVDGTRIIDSWVVQSERQYQQDFIVQPGDHTIVIEYFQASGIAAVHFKMWRVG